jgi:predicted Zn-ribbon and HTH transcriptional regulator
MEANSIVEKIEALSPEQAAMLIQILNEDQGVQVVEAAEKVEALVADVKPKAEKVKCKCCGFAKKARRVNAEGICKVCYMALATSGGESVTVVGRQGKRGRNTVSVMIGGERVKVQRKVRLEA